MHVEPGRPPVARDRCHVHDAGARSETWRQLAAQHAKGEQVDLQHGSGRKGAGHAGDIAQRVDVAEIVVGVESVDEVTLWAVAPGTDSPENWPREAVSEGIELNPHELVTSGVHQIDVYHLED